MKLEEPRIAQQDKNRITDDVERNEKKHLDMTDVIFTSTRFEQTKRNWKLAYLTTHCVASIQCYLML